MIELLERYSFSEIIVFIVLFLLAVKECVNFYDWVKQKFGTAVEKEHKEIKKKDEIQEALCKDQKLIAELVENNKKITDSVVQLNQKVDGLIKSDRDDIKSFLTREHHYYCYQRGWIDDYSLECCERRFQHYINEGGNSFIENFMNELRALPKTAPEE